MLSAQVPVLSTLHSSKVMHRRLLFGNVAMLPAYVCRYRPASRRVLPVVSDSSGSGTASRLVRLFQKLMLSKRGRSPTICRLMRFGRQAAISPVACSQPL